MKTKSFSVILVILFLAIDGIGQNNREQVYVHLNSQILVAGESLLLTAYCRSQLTGEVSHLSKVLYVEIIGSSGPIYQEKLRLADGRGSSEFFVSSLIPTGKYYLVAYTRWMKNFKDYFKSPITIINPFEPGPRLQPNPEELEVKFFIDNKHPLAGASNNIGFKILNLPKKSQLYKGKIVNNAGETITAFNHDTFGLGEFHYTPKVGESYKMILEDELGKINFFDVPMAREKGTIMNLSFDRNILSVNLQSKGSNETKMGTLRIYNEYGQVVERLVGLNSRTGFDLSNLQEELFSVEFLDVNNNVLATRNFYKPGQTGKGSVMVASSYSTRSLVTASLGLEPGTYSISVRKVNRHLKNPHIRAASSGILPFIKDAPVDAAEYLSDPAEVNMKAFLLGSTVRQEAVTPEIRFLPEFRNEFIDGRLFSGDNTPIANEILTVTVFSEPFSIMAAKTDSSGTFSIPIESLSKDTEAVVTPVSLDTTFTIELSSPFMSKEEKFDFALPPLDSNQVKEIISRSIRSQIENAYYKADTISKPILSRPPQIDFNKAYNLDDYTRFNTLQETFLEYIPEANVRERRDQKLRPLTTSVPEELKKEPLILLDGVPVSGNRILEFSTSNIRLIEILNSRYFLGPMVIDGIINFTTFDGKMGRFKRAEYHQLTTISGLREGLPLKSPIHSLNNQSRLPDQRDQLYWNSQVIIDANKNSTINFYTSDVTGLFEIIVEGFQNDGAPVSLEKTFTVNNQP